MKRFKAAVFLALLVFSDLLAMFLSFLLGYLVRGLFRFGAAGGVVVAETLFSRIYLLLLYPFVFVYEGLYTKRLTDWEERRRCFRGVIVASALVTILLFMTRLWIVSRFVVVVAAGLGLILVPLLRTSLKRLLSRAHFFDQPLIIIGNGTVGKMFIQELSAHRTLFYSVTQQITRSAPDEGIGSLLKRVTIPPDALVVVITSTFTPEELKEIFRYAEEHFAELMVVPSSSLLTTSDAEIQQVGNLLVLKYRYNLLRPLNIWTKRVFEFVLCLLLLFLFIPVFFVLAVVVKFSSPGPVFFRQLRVGQGGKTFWCLKFRTMYVDAERRLEELLERNRAIREEWECYARISDDPRVTPVGRFLRRFSLDELPQLYNVLRGEMALVGPRPYLPEELGRVGDYIRTITRVRPGITGLWQVSGRADLPFRERVLLDEFYIRNWSLWLDFSIILRTVKAVVTGRGAY